MATRNHSAVARQSVWVQIGGVIVFTALVAVLVNQTQLQLTGVPLIAAGLVLAVVPAGLWLWLFYDEDRFEPEPRQMVIGVFVLGALLAYAVGQPALRSFFRVQDWLTTNWLTGLLGSILVVGLVQQFLLHAALRYTVYNSSEFDQRIDGIIYGAAAGLGYATLINLQYVVENNGVNLAVGVMRVAVDALALASFGGITGYFLARSKFDKMGPVWLPRGLVIAAGLNGLVSFALDELPAVGTGLGSFGFNDWYGLVAAIFVAGVTFTVLHALIHRLDLAGGPVSRTGSALDKILIGAGRLEEAEWMVWGVVAVGLALGWLVGATVLGRSNTVTVGKVSLAYPASWAPRSEPGALFSAYDLQRGGLYGPRVSLRETAKSDLFVAQAGAEKPGENLDDAAANWSITRETQVPGFRLLNIERTTLSGRQAAQIEYAFLQDPPQGSASGAMPALMHAVDTLLVSGDQVSVLTFAAESHAYDSLRGLQDRLLAGWRVP